jgi:hypothetical protein
VATNKSKNVKLEAHDGPFRYVYVSISAVPGLQLSKQASDGAGTRIIRSFPELGGEAFLTNDCESVALHIDRSTAIGTLLLTGLMGPARFGRLSTYYRRLAKHILGEYWTFARALRREAVMSRESRLKNFAGPGCYLVYRAEGQLLEPASLASARRIGDIGFGFDVVNGKAYRALHKRAVHSTATALSLSLTEHTGSPETRLLCEVIYLTGPGGLVVYPKTITMGAAGIVITNQNPDEAIQAATITVPILMADEKLDGAVSLFVQSQIKSHDNLRAFIPAWSALELLINRLSRLYRDKWVQMLVDATNSLPAWDQDLKTIPLDEYRMRDRFFAVACVLDIGSAETDSKEFVDINNKRSGYYHTMETAEQDLPTQRSQNLFRRYLKLALAKAQPPAL